MVTKIVEFHHDPANGGFYTTSLFWDCECEERYIHPFHLRECPACGVWREDAPDARLMEVIRLAHEFDLDRQLVETAAEEAENDLALIPF